MTPNGQVTTIAGSGGTSGHQDGSGQQARFFFPVDIAVDRAGNLYVADADNGKIRKIDAKFSVTAVPNTGQILRPLGLVFDPMGNMFVVCENSHNVFKIDQGGVVTVVAGSGTSGHKDEVGTAAQFDHPQRIAIDTAGNLYVSDAYNHRIRKIDLNRNVTTIAGSGVSGAMTGGYQDGPANTARFFSTIGIAVDAEGSIYVGDTNNQRIRKIRTQAAAPCVQEGAMRSCYTGLIGTQGVGICKAGTQTCRDGAWSLCVGQVLPQAEVPNGEDDNCNGKIDDVWEVRRAGGNSNDEGRGIAVDSSGNAYITGYFQGAALFGATTLTSAGSYDTYIAKVDIWGNFLWAKSAGGSSDDVGNGIAVDSSGNAYITGRFQGTSLFGATTLSSAGNSDIYVAKVDSGGNFLWAKRVGGINSDLAVDSSGNAYITGSLSGTALFGATTLTSAGGFDTYIAKVDSGGNFIWAKRAGGTSDDYGRGIALDSSGNAYITGSLQGTALYGATTLTSSGSYDTYIAKVDSVGNFLWAKSAGGSSDDVGVGIALDSSGNAYITGYFSGTAVFGATTLTSAGDRDIYVAKLDIGGNFLWAKRAGGISWDSGNGIAVDSSGNTYITGYFNGIAVFGATTLISAGGDDTYIAKVDIGGNFLWAKRAGGTSSDRGSDIALDSSGNAYITGWFEGTAVFGATTLTSVWGRDVFIWKVPAP
jgi:hypothetical protein